MCIAPDPAESNNFNVKGRWTWVDSTTASIGRWDAPTHGNSGEIGLRWPGSGGATHMALLRGTQDSSFVLHWHFGSSSRLWLAEPLNDFSRSVAVPIDTENELNTFCAGQTILGDGRLMVVGGTVVGTTGEPRTPIFDAKTYHNANRGWTTAVDAMDHGRWYATATTLGDGKVLATSGSEFKRMHRFGGTRDSAGVQVLMNDFRPLQLKPDPYWEDDRPGLANRPSPRFGHSAVFWYSHGKIMIFGGARDSSGTWVPSRDVHQKFIYNNDSDHTWAWETITVNGDPTHGYPAPRYLHSAVIVDNVMIVYGGLSRDAQGQFVVLSDVWRLILNGNNTHQWKYDGTNVAPGARYGHTAVIDGDEDLGLVPTMLILGGIAAPPTSASFWQSPPAQNWASDAVWGLTLNRLNQAAPSTWSQLATGGPGKRYGHAAVMDTIDAHPLTGYDRHRMVVFGGDSLGTLTSTVWLLSRPEPMGAGSWTWSWLKPTGGWPSNRARHQAVYDNEWQRLLVVGGDTDLVQGGESGEVWALPLDVGSPSWQQLQPGNAPTTRQAGAAVFDPRPVPAKVPELYAPGGSWSALTTGAKWLDNYPFMFSAKNGKVFYAGNGSLKPTADSTFSYMFDPATNVWSNGTESEFPGGSAALLVSTNGDELVMKCGGADHYRETSLYAKTRTILNPSSGTPGWEARNSLPAARRLHNLTIVPDGRVLISGGWIVDPSPAPTYAMTPYFYHEGTWENPPILLADDLVKRSYHSTALLLPDGRVLAAGGPPTDQVLTATVFWPPYLYKDGTTLATRPIITSYPTETKHRGEPFYLDVNLGDGSSVDSIKIVSLIRPGAVTHSFDQNQRYLALPYSTTHGRLRAQLPDNTGQMPPGDYLLFAVRSGVGGVPSVGKWMRIEVENDGTSPAAQALTVEPFGLHEMNVRWTAPGDDGNAGTAAEYKLRIRTDGPVTEANFENSDPITTAFPRPAGNQESYGATGLNACFTYYFGLKTRDERNNWSALTTGSASTECVPGGGGGGCEFCEELPPSARPTAGAFVAHEAVLRLKPESIAGGLTLTHAGSTAFRIDSVEVLDVVHGPDSTVVQTSNGLRVGRNELATAIRGGAGDVEWAPAGYEAAAGETLTVYFTPTDESQGAIVLQAEPLGTVNDGLRVLIPGPERWRAIAKVSPVGGSETMIENVVADSVQLILGSSYRIFGVYRVTPSTVAPRSSNVAMRSEHSTLGSVQIATGSSVVLEPGTVLHLRPDPPATAISERFVRFRVSSASGTPTRQQRAIPAPAGFALEQNQPNPFGEGTQIRFALPVRSEVTLEVFDLNGRRVRTLSQRVWPAGQHAVDWYGNDELGRRVEPGIYLYRLSAGPFRASRKLILLP